MDIENLMGREFRCKRCGEIHRVSTLYIDNGPSGEIPSFLGKASGGKNKILLLADTITWEAAGEKYGKLIEKEFNVTPVVLSPEKEKRVTARESYLPAIRKEAGSADIIVTVGTGTVTDLGKITGEETGKPVISFPTAPSMNGYTSPVAAYIKEGLKLTIPVTPALAVFSSQEVLSNAPMELIKAGFADSLAKAFANADWQISSIITGESFCSMPYEIVSASEKEYMEKGDMLLKRDPKTLDKLMEALNLGGISMSIAGKSSPASGGEHLISHFLDMYSHLYREEIFAYHGLQVGTGVIFSSLLYEEMKDLSAGDVKILLQETSQEYGKEFERLVSLFPTASTLLEREFREKMRQIMILRESLHDKWEDIKRKAFPMVYETEKIRKVYEKADIPLHISKLGAGEELVLDSLILARFIRGRVTILDLAGETGILEKVARKYVMGDYT